jgi:hypothetical protein
LLAPSLAAAAGAGGAAAMRPRRRRRMAILLARIPTTTTSKERSDPIMESIIHRMQREIRRGSTSECNPNSFGAAGFRSRVIKKETGNSKCKC